MGLFVSFSLRRVGLRRSPRDRKKGSSNCSTEGRESSFDLRHLLRCFLENYSETIIRSRLNQQIKKDYFEPVTKEIVFKFLMIKN